MQFCKFKKKNLLFSELIAYFLEGREELMRLSGRKCFQPRPGVFFIIFNIYTY